MSEESTPFEDAFAKLEETVRILERGELKLEEMVTVYEEGIRLCEHCSRLLDEAEMRMSRLVRSRDGQADVVRFDLLAQAPEPDNAE